MEGMRLGAIAGIDIRVDGSWLIIFFLILWTFTFGVFPRSFPGFSTATYVGMGVIGTLLFFGSILAHEIGHSLVSRAKGIPVPAITLFVFGGMSHARREAEGPGDEFWIAVVGPLTSIAVGALFGVVWWIGQQTGWSTAVTGVAGYLAVINVALAIFNLIPGFPLDGGRIFRSAVWKATDDMTRATRWASTAGKIVGWALIALGVVQFVRAALVGGLWLVFIGWFLRSAAEATYQAHLRRHGGGESGGETPGGRRAA